MIHTDVLAGVGQITNCPTSYYNAATSAGFYAQMTGLLAGFAFAAMVVILSPQQGSDGNASGKRANNEVLLALIAAFVALIFATLTYSVLAGESEVLGRAATEELLDGLPFGLAVMMLFHGITALLLGARVEARVLAVGRTVTVLITPVLTLYYLSNAVSDSETARLRQQGGCGSTPMPALGIVLSLILAAVLAWALLPTLQPARWREATWPRTHQHLAPIVVLVVSVSAAVLDGTVASKTAQFLLPQWLINGFVLTAFGLLLLMGLLLSFQSTSTARRLDYRPLLRSRSPRVRRPRL